MHPRKKFAFIYHLIRSKTQIYLKVAVNLVYLYETILTTHVKMYKLIQTWKQVVTSLFRSC